MWCKSTKQRRATLRRRAKYPRAARRTTPTVNGDLRQHERAKRAAKIQFQPWWGRA